MAIKYETHTSALTLAYIALYKRQRQEGEYLTFKQGSRELQSSPGIIFEAGTTFEDILGRLERISLVEIDKNKQIFSILPKRKSKTK